MKKEPKEDEWRKLVKLLCKVTNEEKMEHLLHLFLTINERDYLKGRMRIVKSLLEQELSQREIAEEMGVSIAKITAGSNALKTTPEGLKKFLTSFLNK